ncbi:unnamed protein product [Albugo candida]|uniref:Uncharacterized protein n=1 Tax=Albugo candida TaxID=65357 RepID=A0A024GCA8_9STRA|nr:unnamed protein product [Albugo candida]|eukprot:CCI44185.1 unnamed protein product [Albugo candida]
MTLLIPRLHLDPSFKNSFVPYRYRNRSTDTTLDFKFVQPFAKLQHFVYFRRILLWSWLVESSLVLDQSEHMVARATKCVKRDIICCTPRCIIIMSVFAAASSPKSWLSSTPELHFNLVAHEIVKRFIHESFVSKMFGTNRFQDVMFCHFLAALSNIFKSTLRNDMHRISCDFLHKVVDQPSRKAWHPTSYPLHTLASETTYMYKTSYIYCYPKYLLLLLLGICFDLIIEKILSACIKIYYR